MELWYNPGVKRRSYDEGPHPWLSHFLSFQTEGERYKKRVDARQNGKLAKSRKTRGAGCHATNWTKKVITRKGDSVKKCTGGPKKYFSREKREADVLNEYRLYG